MAKKIKEHNNKTFILAVIGIFVIILITALVLRSNQFNSKVIQTIEFNPCSDTDRGVDPRLKGTIVSKNMVEEDYCFTGDGTVVDYCKGRFCFIMEHYCTHWRNVNKMDGYRIARNCPGTNTPCYKGACVNSVDIPTNIEEYS